MKDPHLDSSGDGTDPTVALYTAQVYPVVPGNTTETADAQMIACTLAPTQRKICTAGLEFFLATQSDVGTHVSKAELTTMTNALSAFLAER